MGVRAFLLTSVERDGLLVGPDLETIYSLYELDNVEITTSGGIRNLQDILDLEKTSVWGVVVGKAIYDKKFSLREAYDKMGV